MNQLAPHPLDTLLTVQRAQRYRDVLARRTGRLCVVVEDCYDPHNATAIVRTCDAFGIQNVHVTTARNAFRVNRQVSQGSHHYVDLHVHANITAAYAALRSQGWGIMVTDLAATAVVGPQHLRESLAERPLALVFGNESSGVTAEAVAGADGCFLIPMAGFAQSLNVSVSVAVTLYAMRQDVLASATPGDLTLDQQRALYERWVRDHKGEAADVVMRRETGRNGEELESFRA